MGREGRTRLSVDLPTKIHDQVKALAKIRNCTITRWVLRAVITKMLEEKKRNN